VSQLTKAEEAKGMTTKTFNVQGMSCNHCVQAIERALKSLSGVSAVQVDLAQGTVTVTYDEALVGEAKMKEAIEDAGYDVA
jgi:copper ion binding protein